jgi:Tfp pilus assembly protein PilF
MSPGRISSRIVLADVNVKKGKTSEAETIINKVLDADRNNKRALHVLANIKNDQNKLDDLINIYQRIIEIDGKDIDAQLKLGLTYLRGKYIDRAKETARELKKSYMERPEGPYLLGLVHFHERKIDDAIISLQEALKHASIPGAYYFLGLCYLSKEDLELATSAFRRVIDIRPEVVQSRLLLSIAHLKKGREEDAEREIQEVLAVDDENAFAHNLLGNVHLALGNNDLAMKEFDRAIELNPELVDARMKRGAFNLMAGNTRKAEAEFVSAVKIAPDMINSRIVLAKYYIQNKQ